MKASTNSSLHPREQKSDFQIEYQKQDCDQVETNIKRRSCFSKRFKTTFICSCFFLIEATGSYFSCCKQNDNSQPSCKSNIQQYSNIFCHFIVVRNAILSAPPLRGEAVRRRSGVQGEAHCFAGKAPSPLRFAVRRGATRSSAKRRSFASHRNAESFAMLGHNTPQSRVSQLQGAL